MGTDTLIQELCNYSRKVVEKNFAPGPGGNISAREGNAMWISPSGFALDEIGRDQWVKVDIPSGQALGDLRPSSEVLMHLSIYRARDDVQSIVHTHPVYCIGVSSANHNLPPMFADFVALLGHVPSLDYVLPTSPELARQAVRALDSNSALLLKNHGAITVGRNLKEAFYRTEILESAAQIYFISNSLGTPRILSEEECMEIKSLESESYRVNLLKGLKE